MSNKKSFRDFSYNNSDVIVAAVILVIALLLILWRVEVIMDYPSTLTATAEVSETAQDGGNQSADVNADDDATETQGSKKATWDGDALAANFKLKLKGDSTNDLVQSLVDAGLFTSMVDVENNCTTLDLKTSSIKAGTYELTQGMTKEDILKLVTK